MQPESALVASVPQDYVLAHMWLNLAAANGLDDACKERDRIAANMSREQIAEAQMRVRGVTDERRRERLKATLRCIWLPGD